MNRAALQEIVATLSFVQQRLRNLECTADDAAFKVLSKHSLALLNIINNLDSVSHCLLCNVSPLGKEYCSVSIHSADFALPEATE